MSRLGIGFLFAGATCLVGNLTSHRIAAITAAILLTLGVVAITLHRAGLLVDDIIEQERSNPQ